MTSEVGIGNFCGEPAVSRHELRINFPGGFKIKQIINWMPKRAGIFERGLNQLVDID